MSGSPKLHAGGHRIEGVDGQARTRPRVLHGPGLVSWSCTRIGRVIIGGETNSNGLKHQSRGSNGRHEAFAQDPLLVRPGPKLPPLAIREIALMLPAQPNQSAVWNRKARPQQFTLGLPVEVLSTRIGAFKNHRGLHAPSSNQVLLCSIEAKRHIMHHRPDQGADSALEVTHPAVVAVRAQTLDPNWRLAPLLGLSIRLEPHFSLGNRTQ